MCLDNGFICVNIVNMLWQHETWGLTLYAK